MNRKIHYLDLEGLAINGMLKKAEMIDCSVRDKVRRSRIVAETVSGEVVETDCIDYERIVRVWIVVKHYEKWGRDIVSGEEAGVSLEEESEEDRP